MSPGIAVAVVPEEYYRKPKGVLFKKSFRNRADAIWYAEQHSCRLVIACEVDGRYDVLCDPGPAPGCKVSFELVVDRGELVAVPRLTPPHSESRSASPSQASQTSLKIAWDFVHSWLKA
jgi:hypothetical protein